MSTRTSRAISGTLTSFVQFSVRILLQAALAPLVLKMAGQETLGAYFILLQVVGYIALVDLGFGVALSRYMSQAVGHDDGGKRFRDVFETGQTFYLFSNVLFALSIVGFSSFLGTFFSFGPAVETQARFGLWIMAAWSILRVPFAMYGGALMATQNLAATNIINMAGHALRLILSLGTILIGWGLVGLMLSNVAAEATTFGLHRWYYKRTCSKEKYGWRIPDRILFGSMLRFSLGYFIANIGGRIALQSDSIVVGVLHGGAKTSIYYTTQMPAFLLIALIWTIVDNAGPAFHELYARKNEPRLQSSYLRALKYSLMLGGTLGLALLFFNRQLVTLWVGLQQYGGGLMTLSLALFAFASIANHVNAVILGVYGAVRIMSYVIVAGGIINIALSFILGQSIGLGGVMLASAIVEVPVMVVLWAYSLRLLRIPFRKMLQHAVLPALKANGFIAPMGIYYIYRDTQADSLFAFVMHVLVFMAINFLGVITAGVNKDDLQDLRHYITHLSYKFHKVPT